MKSIFLYKDYRKYLSDYYLFNKKNTPDFSYQYFSRLAQLNSPNYLKLVTNGSRNLTVGNIHTFAKAMKLDASELEYFEGLIHMNQAATPLEAKFYRQRLKRIVNFRPKKISHVAMDQLINKWYYPAILVAVEGRMERVVAKEVGKLLNIDHLIVDKILERFVANKLIYIEDGVYHLDEDHYIYFEKQKSRIRLKDFLRSQLAISAQALEDKFNLGKFFSHTMAISMDNFEDYVAEMKDFIYRINRKANQDGADKVVQLNIQLFPLGED